ncbi:MAG: hypothetical protein WC570_04365 [Patescibacteria group bacterium]
MKSERVYSIINYFLYFLLLIALGIILYLLYNNWQKQAVVDNNAANDGKGVTAIDNGQTTGTTETHSSQMGSFSYVIPADWTIEENTEADYAVIRNAQNQNVISVRIVTKPDDLQDLPFDQYAAQAAKVEIQAYQSLNEIKQINAEDGIVGYWTTWNIQFLGGEQFVSQPITYFEHPIDPAKSVQITLENDKYTDDYNYLINSFRIEK